MTFSKFHTNLKRVTTRQNVSSLLSDSAAYHKQMASRTSGNGRLDRVYRSIVGFMDLSIVPPMLGVSAYLSSGCDVFL